MMDPAWKIRLDILHKIHGYECDGDSSSSDSETETGIAGTNGTPRSLGSDDSSILTSPRANLLWDHGFDVSETDQDVKSPVERALEWKRFNKTDDDKLKADRKVADISRLRIQEIANHIQDMNSTPNEQQSENIMNSPRSLPDLVSSTSSSYNNNQFENKLLYVNDSPPPPLPDSDPPLLDLTDEPPPLPCTSPPTLRYIADTNIPDSDDTVYTYYPDIDGTKRDNESILQTSKLYSTPVKACIFKDTFGQSSDPESITEDTTNDENTFEDTFGQSNDRKNMPEDITNDENTFEDTFGQSNDRKNMPEDITNDENTFEDTFGQSNNRESITEDTTNGENNFEDAFGQSNYPENITEDSVNDKHDYILKHEDFAGLISDTDSELTKDKKQHVLHEEDAIINIEMNNDETNQCENMSETAEPQFESIIQSLNLTHTQDLSSDQMEDVEAEFESILQLLDLAHTQDTYVERFAGRRDTYGFILSPIGEAPSPSPSSFSGYSGISCASPDPFSNFRMSPSPRGVSPDSFSTFRMSPGPRGNMSDLDLSSLAISGNIDIENEQTVPIYQTVQAKKAFVIPDGYGWDSEDDLFSSLGSSGEWEAFQNGLSSPPVSTASVNLTQFGTHISGWRHPDTVIYEEPEVTSLSDDSNSTIEGEEQLDNNYNSSSESDTDDTIDDDSPRVETTYDRIDYKAELEGNEKESNFKEFYIDNSIQEYSNSEENIYTEGCELICRKRQDENNIREDTDVIGHNSTVTVSSLNGSITPDQYTIEQLSSCDSEHEQYVEDDDGNENNKILVNTYHAELNETNDSIDVELEIQQSAAFKMATNENFQDINNEVVGIIDQDPGQLKTAESILSNGKTNKSNIPSVEIREKQINIPAINLQKAMYTSDEGPDSSDSNEDAEDEYSESDDNAKGSSCLQLKEMDKLRIQCEKSVDENRLSNRQYEQKEENIHVKEFISPRSAKILLGSMFPGESDSSYTSFEDENEDGEESGLDQNMSSYGSGVRVTQYTSDDSDAHSEGKAHSNMRHKLVSFRKESDISPGEILCSQTPDSETDRNVYTPSLSIQSPLDFAVFGSKLDMLNNTGGIRSPRVFGRYYSELDKTVTDNVAKPRDIKSVYFESTKYAAEEPDHEQDSSDDDSLEDLDNSFKNVVFLHKNKVADTSLSTGKAMKQVETKSHSVGHFEMGCSYSENTKTEDFNEKHIPEAKTDLCEQKSHTHRESLIESEVHINTNVDCSSEKSNEHASMPQLAKECHKNDIKSQQTPMKIKVSHLTRQDSTRNRIKRGYVHQLSEIFSKTNNQENENSDIRIKKTKKDNKQNQRPETPKLLTAKDNLIIEKAEQDNGTMMEENEPIDESLGFEVSPFKKVDTFDDTSKNYESMLCDTAVHEEDFESETSDTESDTHDYHELTVYEQKLRHVETGLPDNDDDVNDNNDDDDDDDVDDNDTGDDYDGDGDSGDDNDDHKGGDHNSDSYDKNGICEVESMHGTGEFKPYNDIIYNRNESPDEEEIEEYKARDCNSDQSEDEELLEKKHAVGHDGCDNTNDNKKTTHNEYLVKVNTPVSCETGGREIKMTNRNKTAYSQCLEDCTSNDHPLDTCQALSTDGQQLSENNNNKPEDTDITDSLTKDEMRTYRDSNLSSGLWRPNSTRDQKLKSKSDAYLYKSCTAGEYKEHHLSAYEMFARIGYPSISKYNLHNSMENITEDGHLRVGLNAKSQTENTNTKVENEEKELPPVTSHIKTQTLGDIDQPNNKTSTRTRLTKADFAMNDHSSKLDQIRQHHDFDNKIRYPASLSRRLYGPYIRQHAEYHMDTMSPVTDIVVEPRDLKPRRGITTPRLSHIKDTAEESRYTDSDIYKARTESKDNCNKEKNLDNGEILQNYDKVNKNNQRITTRPRGSRLLNCAEHGNVNTNTGESCINHLNSESCTNHLNLNYSTEIESTFVKLTNNSTGSLEGQAGNPDVFGHTCYDARTPYSHLAQRESIKFNSKPITMYCVRSEAQRIKDSEKFFVKANQRPAAVHTDARNDKQIFDFSKSACLSTTGKSANIPVNVNSGVYCSGIISRNIEKGGEQSQTDVDDFYHRTLGVDIPQEIASTENTHQNVNMKNDIRLSESTVNETSPTSHRINSSTLAATYTINQPRMSTGDVHSTDSGRAEEDDSLSETDTEDEHASVTAQTADYQHVLEDEKGHLKLWPYSDFENSDKLPVTLHKARKRINIIRKYKMGTSSEKSSSMTVIQNAQHSAEMPENKMIQKYHSSSVIPAVEGTSQLMQTHGDSIQAALMTDKNGNTITEEEIAAVLPKIADSVSNMKNVEAEEILPGITQSVTQLKNGGNLVITTMTRKLDEIDSDDSSGRGSPEPTHPILNVEDLENSNIYLVQDSKGELFYVEDITSDTQESAYFSSSRNTSESVSDGGNSPTFQRISKIKQVGNSGIKESTAEEIISSMYEQGGGVHEITENEKEWSERTYQYDLPSRHAGESRKDYSKEAFNTSYMVEEPETLPRSKTTTRDRYETSYEMSEGAPWVYDGGMGQSYSQATQGVTSDEIDSVSALSATDEYNMRMRNAMQTSEATATGYTKSSEQYSMETEAQIYPLVPYPAQTLYAVPPAPLVYPPAPLCVQTDTPQYSLVKVDVTPKREESVTTKSDVIDHNIIADTEDRPIYKTVAHIKTGDKKPPVKKEMTEKKRYKILASKASPSKEEEEVQESHMSFNELDYKFTSENVEYKMSSPTLQRKQIFVRNSTNIEQPTTFRSQQHMELNKKPDRKFKTEIQVQDSSDNNVQTMEENSYSFSQMKANTETSDANMRVVRGSYLIKNTLDEVDGTLDDNLNMFDGNFTLCKDNPLYQSDEDLYRRLEREKIENSRKQQRFQRDLNQDITFDTVDKFSKSKTVKRDEKPKQSVSELLLSRLSTIDSKDIRQHIDVKHHSEDVYGDPRFMHADGSAAAPSSSGTSNFDSVGEKVDLLLKEGKAFITVKVTAERVTPVDLEFNVWRKNQAIVTRTIEIDLLATEQRRRLYYHAMEDPGHGSRVGYRSSGNETVLDSQQTLDLFTRILGAADGEGDKEDITVKTRTRNTTRPFTSGMDLLY